METAKKLWHNRKEKKEWARRLQSEDPGLEVVHPHAAGMIEALRKLTGKAGTRSMPAL